MAHHGPMIPAILEKYHWTYLDVGKNHIINYNWRYVINNAAICSICPGASRVYHSVKRPYDMLQPSRGADHFQHASKEHGNMTQCLSGNWEYIMFQLNFECMMSISLLLPVESSVISLAQIVHWFKNLVSFSILLLWLLLILILLLIFIVNFIFGDGSKPWYLVNPKS